LENEPIRPAPLAFERELASALLRLGRQVAEYVYIQLGHAETEELALRARRWMSKADCKAFERALNES
jgi:hypothetical protein